MIRNGTALLSAADKDGLDKFAARLLLLGWDILASSGTAKYLRDKGHPVRDVAEIVGEPILGHRVVTLSREIHAALLATNSEEDQAELARLGIPRIDLVYVNFYPLMEEIAKPNATLWSVIEKTDIGGPTMLRSAAKGRRIVISKREDFDLALNFIGGIYPFGDDRESTLSYLASVAEAEVASYCSISATYHDRVAMGEIEID